jgi:CheY-like chemotaxis protein
MCYTLNSDAYPGKTMANNTRIPNDLPHMAEGEPHDPHESSPPKHKTAGLVSAALPKDRPRSATGFIGAVRMGAENPDKTDKQDASRPRDETHPSRPNLQTVPQATISGKTRTGLPRTPVLIVEDTIELAEVIQATLESMGLDAIYATHGRVGLEKMKQLNPGLVLMDIGLPDITGWKMLDSIKEHYTARGQELPLIIVITAYGDPANRLIGKLQGIYSYLIKPFTPNEVERLVTMALRGDAAPDQPDESNR